MTEGAIDLRLLLQSASEPQTSRPRNNTGKNKSNNNKENRLNKAGVKGPKAGKKQSEHLPLDKAHVERFFNAAENVVFASNRLHPQPPPPSSPPAGIENLQLLNRLTISSPRKQFGSPMSIENQPQGGDSPYTTSISQPALPPPSPSNNPIPEQPQPQTAEEVPVQPLSTQEIDLLYRQRCAIDSDAMLTSCPPHLVQVNQTFPKQAAAIKLADQCNAGLPVIIEPEVLLSAVSEVPKKPQVIGGVHLLPQPNPSSEEQPLEKATGSEDPTLKEPSTVEKEPEKDGTAVNEVPPEPVIEFFFNFAEVRQVGSDAAGPSSEQQQEQESEEGKESDRKRARSDASAALMKQMQDAYAAALAQLNAPAAAPLPPRPQPPPGDHAAGPSTEDVKTISGGGVAQPTVSGDTSTSSLGLPQQSSLGLVVPRRTQEAIRVFCVEIQNEWNNVFYRNFTATSYANVWRSYVNARRPGSLHWYEVIREGRPCHLYFDLEFARNSALNFNMDVDGDGLVDALLHHVGAILLRNWGLKLDPQTQVYELDSCTAEKFSRHLIVRLPGHAFYNNLAIGHFVSQVLLAAGTELNILKNPPTSEERVPFVDTAVYTKNRHFRLVYSSKGGKTAILQPTQRYATGGQGIHKLSPARIFNDTLICNVDEDVKLLAVLPPFRDYALAGIPGGAMAATTSAGGAPSYGVGVGNNMMGNGIGSGDGIHQGDVHGRTVAWKRSEYEDASVEGDAATFLKDLKRVAEKAVPFVEEAAKKRSGQDARARTVAFCGMDGLVAYSMIGAGSHYCEHIGRAHKNNHVYFVANFSAGVYAQKCHDPDCSRFRSAWMPLPKELCLNSEEDLQEGHQKEDNAKE